MKYKDKETDEQSSSGEDTAAPASNRYLTQDERADYDGPYGSDDDSDDDDSDDVVSDDDTTWLD